MGNHMVFAWNGRRFAPYHPYSTYETAEEAIAREVPRWDAGKKLKVVDLDRAVEACSRDFEVSHERECDDT